MRDGILSHVSLLEPEDLSTVYFFLMSGCFIVAADILCWFIDHR